MSADIIQFPAPSDPVAKGRIEAQASELSHILKEREAQRRSWVIGELMLDDPALTKDQAEKLYSQVFR